MSQRVEEFRKYNQKLFLCPPQEQVLIQLAFSSALFHDKCILWHIELSTYRKIKLRLKNNICLVLSSLKN